MPIKLRKQSHWAVPPWKERAQAYSKVNDAVNIWRTCIKVFYYCFLFFNHFVFILSGSAKKRIKDDQINSFQALAADVFFGKWSDLVGWDGIANYAHMVGASHLLYCLTKWHNLHQFHNQGWEAYNKQIAWVHQMMLQRTV